MSLSRNSDGGIGVEAFRAAASFDAAKLKNSTVSHTHRTLSRRSLFSFIVAFFLDTWKGKTQQILPVFFRRGERERKGGLGYDLQDESTVSRLSARTEALFMTSTAATDSCLSPVRVTASPNPDKLTHRERSRGKIGLRVRLCFRTTSTIGNF